MVVYVDIILMGNNHQEFLNTKARYKDILVPKILIEALQNHEGIVLLQQKYTFDLL